MNGTPQAKEPLVSLVIPVFNGMPHLKKTVASIRKQTYPRIELLAVDGGSTDDSVPWLREAGVPIEVLPPPSTVAETWTRATQRAAGDLIMLVCQDDILYPTAIEEHVRALSKSPACPASFAQRDIIDAQDHVISRSRGLGSLPAGIHPAHDLFYECFLQGTNVAGEPHCVMMRREVLLDAMPWDGDRPYLIDLDTYQKALAGSDQSIVLIRNSLGAFRVSASSWSTRLARVQLQQIRSWQEQFASSHSVTLIDRVRARVNARKQSVARRLAYAYLALRSRL